MCRKWHALCCDPPFSR
ncbi:MAG: hypothetical protein ACI4Q6_06555 [Huintestinicola sp.]